MEKLTSLSPLIFQMQATPLSEPLATAEVDIESDGGQMLLLRAWEGAACGPRSDEMLSLRSTSLQQSQKSVGCPDPHHMELVRRRAASLGPFSASVRDQQ